MSDLIQRKLCVGLTVMSHRLSSVTVKSMIICSAHRKKQLRWIH